MPDPVTRCPKCQTAFRITHDQLQIARGAVRCGSCLHIFKAVDYWVTPPSPETPGPATHHDTNTAEENDRDGAQQSTETDDDFLISDNMSVTGENPSLSLEGEIEEGLLDADSQGRQARPLFDHQSSNKSTENIEQTDESWADELLEEDDSQPSPSRPVGDNDTSLSDDNPRNACHSDTNNNNDSTQSEPPQPLITLVGSDDEEHIDQGTTEQTSESSSTETEVAPATNVMDPAVAEALEQPNPLDELLSNLEPSPVEISCAPNNRRWPHKLLWGSLSLIAALGLIGQVGWIKFEQLSREQPYRDIYATLCPLLQCQLPPLHDRRQIQAYNLVVRSHPQADNALIVDAIMLNNAAFAQPFPPLQLSFSNLQGKTIAQRRFTAGDYLGGELAGQHDIPSGQPIHLSLEIIDPGREAVNYAIDIPL